MYINFNKFTIKITINNFLYNDSYVSLYFLINLFFSIFLVYKKIEKNKYLNILYLYIITTHQCRLRHLHSLHSRLSIGR